MSTRTADEPFTSNLPGGGHVTLRSVDAKLLAAIHGEFRLGWLGALSRALSRRKIDIVSLSAELSEVGLWDVELELSAAPLSLSSLDLVQLLREGDVESSKRDALHIESASLKREASGALLLEVIAKDELGFLAQLLGRLGFLGAFPEKIVAKSEGGRLMDSFWLRSFGRSPLSEHSEAAIAHAFAIPSVAKRPSVSPPSLRS